MLHRHELEEGAALSTHQTVSETDQTTIRQEPDLEVLRRRLRHGSRANRAAAEVELAALSVGDLIRLMAIEQRKRRGRRTALIVGISIYLALVVAMIIVTHKVIMLNYIGSFTGLIGAAAAFSSSHKSAAMALAKYDAIEGVGALIEALEIPDEKVQEAVRASLAGMLPRLRASNSSSLTPEQRKILCRSLTHAARGSRGYTRRNALTFVLALLKALEQIGDESFKEPVERLAAGTGMGRDEAVRAAAQACLPALLQRIENQHLSSDLLRGASPTVDVHSQDLLRAAQSAGQTDESALLRPTEDARS